ncbi:iron-sulfur cluster assembly protein [Saccharomonospora sp. NPDC006951]
MNTGTVAGHTTTAVWSALGAVLDPELDEPVTRLGFVHEVEVGECEAGGAVVRVVLRLPTYFCAPNFAYLMVADAADAVRAVPGVTHAEIVLCDHFAAAEINAGVAEEHGFAAAFPGEATGEPAVLRRTFQRKAYLASLDRVCGMLLARGWRPDELTTRTLADVPDSPERRRLVRRRAALGLPCDPDSVVLVDEDGVPIPSGQVTTTLRFARAVRVSIEGNAGLCTGLLRTRYGGVQEDGS